MAVDPQCQRVLDAARSAEGGSAFETQDANEARRRYSATTAFFAPPTPDLESVEKRAIPGPAGPVPLRVYRPKAEAGPSALPVLVFYHGGGWVFGDLDSHDAVCRCLAHEAACLVVSVDYRLAPEHKFPGGLEDCMAALRWAGESAGEIGGDRARIAVGGDSAGGNLAASISRMARDEGGPAIVLQVLIYPATDFTADNASLTTNGEGYLLTREAMDWCQDAYLGGAEEMTDPRASPALTPDLSGLPPAWVMTAEYDPLRDEGKAYAEAMAAAGVAVEYVSYAGMIHGFVRMGAIVERAGEAITDAARALKESFRI